MSKMIESFKMVFDPDETETNRFCLYEDYATDDQNLISRFRTEDECIRALERINKVRKGGQGLQEYQHDKRYSLLTWESRQVLEIVDKLCDEHAKTPDDININQIENDKGVLLGQLIALQHGQLTFIPRMETVNTGGHCMVDFLFLEDGRVLAVNEEICALYRNEEDFYEGDHTDQQIIALGDDSNPKCYLDQARLHNKKVFLCFWSREAFALPSAEEDKFSIEKIGFFCDDNSYDPEDIDDIKQLSVNQEWTSGDYGDYHTVKRLA